MRLGCIHGRFQPFHNGHLEYFEGAFLRSDFLFIGITQYEQTLGDTGSPKHRLEMSNNPFSYWERCEIIKAAIGSRRNNVLIVPFPIHDPSKISNYVDPAAIMHTTIYDQWNIEKADRLKRHGFLVNVLWKRDEKKFEGSQVREALRHGDSTLSAMVPSPALDVIVDLRKRRPELDELLMPLSW